MKQTARKNQACRALLIRIGDLPSYVVIAAANHSELPDRAVSRRSQSDEAPQSRPARHGPDHYGTPNLRHSGRNRPIPRPCPLP